MRTVLRLPPTFVVTSVVLLFVLSLLLTGGAPIPLGATSHSSPGAAANAVLPPRSSDRATPVTPGVSDAPDPIGHVVASPLLNYNTTIPLNFGSSVWDWGVGPGTLVPSTGDLWLSVNLTQGVVAARLRACDQAVDAFERIDHFRERLGHDFVHRKAGIFQNFFKFTAPVSIPTGPLGGEIIHRSDIKAMAVSDR